MTQAPSNPTRQSKPWDGDEELRKLIGNNDELSAIYRKLGYSVYVDQESQRILNQLKSLVGIEIVDPTAFGRLLYDTRNVRFNQLRETEQRDFLAPKKAGKRARVCQNKRAKPENPEKLKAFFNRHPHAVRAISLLLLAGLEELFTKAHTQLSAGDRESLLSAVSRVREDAERRGGDPASALQSFEWAREECLGRRRFGPGFREGTDHERKAQLDELLSNSLRVREMRGQDDAQWHKDAAKQAKTYIDSSWMHTPWLTARFLTDLLDVELVPLSREAKSPQTNVGLLGFMPITSWFLPQPWATFVPPILSFLFLLVSVAGIYFLFSVGLRWAGWVWIAYLCWHYYSRFNRGHIFAKEQARLTRLGQLLGQVRDEVDSGNYDAQEIAERLRHCEDEGLYVHSLVYALLRLVSPNG